jgi:hypothetical protein
MSTFTRRSVVWESTLKLIGRAGVQIKRIAVDARYVEQPVKNKDGKGAKQCGSNHVCIRCAKVDLRQ